ncbi:MAG: hypothetical protein HKN54_01325, partial [Flavobacteriaceae bacterium]|nr:hypothetical protein [Flavobacteriaceae bacterium]
DTLSRNASGFTVFMPSEGVINDIIGSGKLDMISNIELRRKIASWEADLRMIREFEKLSREADDKYAVHSTQYFDDVNGKFRQAAFIENKRSIFLKDNILSNSMVDLYGLSKILNRHYLEKSKDIDSLIAIIDSELK